MAAPSNQMQEQDHATKERGGGNPNDDAEDGGKGKGPGRKGKGKCHEYPQNHDHWGDWGGRGPVWRILVERMRGVTRFVTAICHMWHIAPQV